MTIGFKFQHSICNGCHYQTLLSVNISDITIITVKAIDYPRIICDSSTSEELNILKNSVLDDRRYKKILTFALQY